MVIVLVVIAAYLSLWPVPNSRRRVEGAVAPGYTGPHAANNKLAGLTLSNSAPKRAPSTCAGMGRKLYAAMASGNIVRMNPDGSAQEVFANTGGRCSASTSTPRAG